MSSDAPLPSPAAVPELPAAASTPDHGPVSAPSSQTLLPLSDDASPAARAPDEGKHPKGKRKRTAAKDKSILEQAYKSNPKPDKQARLEIVDRVSLSEKEVQIWFQNRRQNDRRKSRPLSPEELAALRYGGIHGGSAESALQRSNPESDGSWCALDRAGAARAADGTSVSPTLNRDSPDQSQSLADASTPNQASQETTPPQPGRTPRRRDDAPSSRLSQPSETMSHSFSSSVGYLANRWNVGSCFSTPSTLGDGGHGPSKAEPCPPSSCPSDAGRSMSRSQSQVRLSLSLEGKAELVSSQPSPERAAPPRPSSALSGPPLARRAGLQRSHSALPSITLPPISALTSGLPPRLGRGRSRDVHAWESCADSERRDELTTQAEHESNGSAIAAISLLRSSSAILQPSFAKRNASVSRPLQARQAKRAKFGRTSSTYARLESAGTELEPRDCLKGKVKVAMLVTPNDSDKENWSPDEDAGLDDRQRRRPLPADPPSKPQPARRQARGLQEAKRPGLLGSRANTAPSGLPGSAKGGAVEIYEDPAKRSRDDEVARFMRGEVSPSKKGDMDCVAGLLSLSQGAWR